MKTIIFAAVMLAGPAFAGPADAPGFSNGRHGEPAASDWSNTPMGEIERLHRAGRISDERYREIVNSLPSCRCGFASDGDSSSSAEYLRQIDFMEISGMVSPGQADRMRSQHAREVREAQQAQQRARAQRRAQQRQQATDRARARARAERRERRSRPQ